MDGQVLKSRDGGGTWTVANGSGDWSLASQMVMSLAYVNATRTLYAGTEQGLFQSRDGGATWGRLGLPTDVAALAVRPDNPRVLLIVDSRGRVYRSTDGGQTWGSGQRNRLMS